MAPSPRTRPDASAVGPLAEIPQITGERPAPLVQTTLQRLLHDILAGVYGPGHRIREEEVALRLGVSRAPVREALRVLEQDGLIEIVPWRGARVVSLGAEQLADLFDLLATVYGAVARLVVRHASPAELRQVLDCIVTLRQRISGAGETGEFVRIIDLSFHLGTLLGRCSGSLMAERMLRQLGRISYLQHRHLAPLPRAWLRQSDQHLRRLEEALRARSQDRADTAARKVIRHTATLLLKRVAAKDLSET